MSWKKEGGQHPIDHITYQMTTGVKNVGANPHMINTPLSNTLFNICESPMPKINTVVLMTLLKLHIIVQCL